MFKKNLFSFAVAAAFLVLIVFAAYYCKAPEKGEFAPGSFSFSGGTGRVQISCESVKLDHGRYSAVIVFSSPHYSYVKVNDVKYEGSYTPDTSSFEIPVEVDQEFPVIGCTTAMSVPHEVEYRLLISLNTDTAALGAASGGSLSTADGSASDPGSSDADDELKRSVREKAEQGFTDADAPVILGLNYEYRLDPEYADCFDVFYYDKDFRVVAVADGSYYLVVPSGAALPGDLKNSLPENIRVIYSADNIYVAATGSMSLFDALGSIDRVKYTGTDENGWNIEAPVSALENGSMVYAGKYSAPDFELLLDGKCDLAVESTMILHSPEIKEQLTALGIPVFTDFSGYERTAAGKSEWIYAYAAILGLKDRADAVFAGILDAMKEYESYEKTGKRIALFYINNAGLAVIRGNEDYLTDLLIDGGGENAFKDAAETPGDSTIINLSMEDFYRMAADADYIIYNGTIDASVEDLSGFLGKSELLSRFKAVKEEKVFLLDKRFYQSTDRLYMLAGDVNKMLNGDNGGLEFLRKL